MAGVGVFGGGKRQRGGHSPLPLNPENYESLGSDPMVPANYAKMPNVFPSNQVGGAAYGYAAGSDVTPYGGSYAPATPVCTGGTIAGRGGNNIMQGGMKKKWRQRGCKSKKGCKGGAKKRSTKKGGSKKRSTKKGGSKKRSMSKRSSSKKNKRGGAPVIM